MKKMLGGLVALGALSVMLVGCGSNNATDTDAAKALIDAMGKGDAGAIQKLDHSNPLEWPPQTLIEQANDFHLIGHSSSDVTFKTLNDRDVQASFPHDGKTTTWFFRFSKESDGYYLTDMSVSSK